MFVVSVSIFRAFGIKFARKFITNLIQHTMCFSAGASFTAAAVLGTIGVFSLRKASTHSQLMFAGIPVLFGVQQINEGLLWLSLSYAGYESWQTPVTYLFLFFAQFLWPLWIPVSFILMEHNKTRRKILWTTVVAGAIGSSILAYRLLFNHVHAEVREHHIYYDIESTQAQIIISSIMYVVAIIFPPFISSVKGSKPIAFLLLISLLATKMLYEAYLISVWCFFAASLSILIIRVMHLLQNEVFLSNKKFEHRTD